MMKYKITPQKYEKRLAVSNALRVIVAICFAFAILYSLFYLANSQERNYVILCIICGSLVLAGILLLSLSTIIDLLNESVNQKYVVYEIDKPAFAEPDTSEVSEEPEKHNNP